MLENSPLQAGFEIQWLEKKMATSTAHLYIHFASAKSLWILFVIFKPSLHCRTRISKVHNAACIFMVHGNRRVYVQA